MNARLWPAALAFISGCAVFGGSSSGPTLPSVPGEQAKCKVASGQSSPLVTEWPASEKANLEAMIGAGGVAVAYSGCAMRVLPQCRLGGSYRWQRTTPATDLIEIKDADELYAKLPLGAASLEGELKRSGQLSVSTTVSGQLKLENLSTSAVPSEGDCASATHLVGALSIGAFALSAGAETSGRASASVAQIGEAGGNTSRSKGVVRSAGDVESCGQSTLQAPNANCMSPIQVFLWPLPGRAAEDGPPGTVKVDFVSASANGRWDVYADDEVVCSTPCSKWVDPNRPLMLRARESTMMFMPADKLTVSGVGDHAAPGGEVQLRAHPLSRGMFMTGLGIGGVGVSMMMMGGMLAGLSCGDGDRLGSDRCTPGLWTLGIGVPVAAIGVWLLIEGLPHAQWRGMNQMAGASPPKPRRNLLIGPGFVAGRF